MVGALIGSVVTIVLAIIGSAWRISAKLAYQDATIAAIRERIEHIERIVDPASAWNRRRRL